jgi:hypothetical protein
MDSSSNLGIMYKSSTYSLYKCHFRKLNIEFGQQHPSPNSWIKKLHIQISILCMSVVPGPASQDAVFKLVYTSLALQCILLFPLRFCGVRLRYPESSGFGNILCIFVTLDQWFDFSMPKTSGFFYLPCLLERSVVFIFLTY